MELNVTFFAECPKLTSKGYVGADKIAPRWPQAPWRKFRIIGAPEARKRSECCKNVAINEWKAAWTHPTKANSMKNNALVFRIVFLASKSINVPTVYLMPFVNFDATNVTLFTYSQSKDLRQFSRLNEF